MLTLFEREIRQELSGLGVGDPRRRALIKAPHLELHAFDSRPRGVDTQRTAQPHGAALHKPFDILSPNEGDVFAEAFAIEIDEPPAMPRLLSAHLLEPLR